MSHSPKPNIIYILGDDHRAEQLSCMEHPLLKTPNIDDLAKQGTLFQNAFCTSPVCTPSRVSHYLGQWERTHGVNFNSNSNVAPTAWEKSFPSILKQNGYFTGWVGKNHVPAGEGGYDSGFFEKSFDYFYGNHGHSTFYPKEIKKGGVYSNAKSDTQIEIFLEGALNFLDPQDDFYNNCSQTLTKRPDNKPFCLCITFNLPHASGTETMQLRPSDDDIYKSLFRDRFNDVPIPTTYISKADLKEPKIPNYVYNNIQLASYDYVNSISALKERRIREYQTITGIDRMLGVIRAKLDELKLANNTIIVFSTDHGIHHGEHGLGGKNLLYEQDLRIPCIIYDPRLEKKLQGQVLSEMLLVPDLAPTMLELADLPIPDSMQGKSATELLKGNKTHIKHFSGVTCS